MEAQSEHVHVAYTFFWHVLAPIRTLSRRLVTKTSASELHRKFIKSALCWLGVAIHAHSHVFLGLESVRHKRWDTRYIAHTLSAVVAFTPPSLSPSLPPI